MSGDERQSPRAAIRNWLSVTEPEPGHVLADTQLNRHDDYRRLRRRSSKGRANHHNVIPSDKQGRLANEFDLPSHDRRDDKTEEMSSNDIAAVARKTSILPPSGQRLTSRSKGPPLAERLNLHPPFRTFRDGSDDGSFDRKGRIRTGKRQHSRSSTSSYLESAAASDLTRSEHVDDAGVSEQKLDRRTTTRYDLGASPNTVTLAFPDKLHQTYERRPRRKTREDRYELKEAKANFGGKRAKAKDRDKKKHRKRRRTEKSGTALMHDFSAKNVSHERLTLQPRKSLGLFGKGRASSPVKRRGRNDPTSKCLDENIAADAGVDLVPDLVFSETNFLNSRRTKPDDPIRSPAKRQMEKSKRRKSTKAADTEAEISRYFTSSKPPEKGLSGSRTKKTRTGLHPSSTNRDSLPPIIDLLDTPFLGFGSCGANSVSPVKGLGSPAMRELERRLTRSPTRSTSYLTWSQSGVAKSHTSHNKKYENTALESPRPSNHARGSPTIHKLTTPRLHEVSTPIEQTYTKKSPATQAITLESANRNRIQQAPNRDLNLTSKDASDVGNVRQHHDTSNNNIQHNASCCNGQEPPKKSVEIPILRHRVSQQEDSNPSKTTSVHQNVPPAEPRSKPSTRLSIPPQTSESCNNNIASHFDATLDSLIQDCRSSNEPRTMNPHATESSRQQRADQTSTAYRPQSRALSDITCQSIRSQHDDPTVRPRPLEHPARRCKETQDVKAQARFELDQRVPLRPQDAFTRDSYESHTRPSTMGYQYSSWHSPDRSTFSSRNAWGGYDTIYGQQEELEYLPINKLEDGEDSQYVGKPAEVQTPLSDLGEQSYNMTEEGLDPMEFHHQVNHFGYAPIEFTNSLSSAEYGTHDEAYYHGDSWCDVEENLFADSDEMTHDLMLEEQGIPYRDRDFDQDQRHQHTGLFHQQTPQHQSIEPHVQSVLSPWQFHTSHPGYGSHSFPKNGRRKHNEVDKALSGFWTPHKLY